MGEALIGLLEIGGRGEMCKATIALVSPGGVPVTLEVASEDDQKAIAELRCVQGFCRERRIF